VCLGDPLGCSVDIDAWQPPDVSVEGKARSCGHAAVLTVVEVPLDPANTENQVLSQAPGCLGVGLNLRGGVMESDGEAGCGRRTRRAGSARRGLVSVLAGCVFLIASAAGPAWAHGEESDQAAVLVEQAIALIANRAEDEHVAERIQDALEAPDQMGVDTAQVQAALELIEQPGEGGEAAARARAVLLAALGGKLPSASTAGPAVGTETGTSVVLDEFRPERGISDGGDVALLVVAVAAMAVGMYLARRWRPPHTIRQLEHGTIGKGKP